MSKVKVPYQPHPGVVSLKAFIFGMCLTVEHICIPTQTWLGFVVESVVYGITGITLLAIMARAEETKLKPSGMSVFQVQSRSFFLGCSMSCGLKMIFSDYSTPFGLYVCLLTFFHYSEFIVTSWISPETLSLDSFLLNHSKEYGVAALASAIEFSLEAYYLPWLKVTNWITGIGIFLCIYGEVLRKSAMFTASKNFTHLVRERKVDGQYLVTTGPYAIFRHPGYAGWFWWSVGTQFVMINPFCIIGYCLAVHKFFNSRIYYEEICLISFFGLDYVEYQKMVTRTGVPFVKGYLSSTDRDKLKPCSLQDEENDSSSSDENFQRIEHEQLIEEN